MKVYFSGISGTGIGPLAEFAADAGFEVCGSDLRRGAIAEEIDKRDIRCSYGEQDGSFMRQVHNESPIDWFVYTSALPEDHPELQLAKELGIKYSKRDEFLAELIKQKDLKLIAIAGTHGKTTTTAEAIWTFKRLGIPVSYLIGTTLSWGHGAEYIDNSKYVIYEADEYDRNFLHFAPHVAIITCVDYDHADIYPSVADYQSAFAQFESQSNIVIKKVPENPNITLAGAFRRRSADKIYNLMQILRDKENAGSYSDQEVIDALNSFPGAGRRFEKIADNVYSDYAHLPDEIEASLGLAEEIKKRDQLTGIAVVYQPHQNIRQHQIREGYYKCFQKADKVFWLPTFLSREKEGVEILGPETLITELSDPSIAKAADMNDELAEELRALQKKAWLIILMSAGSADAWYRAQF